MDGLGHLKNSIKITPNLMPISWWKCWHWLAKFKYQRANAYAKVTAYKTPKNTDLDAPKDTISKTAHDYFVKKWSTQWQNTDSDKYGQTRFWFPLGPRSEISKLLIKKNRQSLGTIVQFLSGHGWLNRHKWIVDPDSGIWLQ